MVKDVAVLVAILATVWSGNLELLVWGQLWASMLTFAVVMVIACRGTSYGINQMLKDFVPALVPTLFMTGGCLLLLRINICPPLLLLMEIAGGGAIYIGISRLMRLPELQEAAGYLFGRFRRK